ncbi:hypothetical protein [Mesorhizobium sp.]|uniref:hypothetical protein n=1 Tax=Mesorhizobium sp. TaxID=1871066 RepID=UPI0025E7070E|nr:hypothetical protein [Mesorhizobium sp.]
MGGVGEGAEALFDLVEKCAQTAHFRDQARDVLACCGHKILVCNGRAGQFNILAALCSAAGLDEIRPSVEIPTFDPRFPRTGLSSLDPGFISWSSSSDNDDVFISLR